MHIVHIIELVTVGWLALGAVSIACYCRWIGPRPPVTEEEYREFTATMRELKRKKPS